MSATANLNLVKTDVNTLPTKTALFLCLSWPDLCLVACCFKMMIGISTLRKKRKNAIILSLYSLRIRVAHLCEINGLTRRAKALVAPIEWRPKYTAVISKPNQLRVAPYLEVDLVNPLQPEVAQEGLVVRFSTR